MKEKVQEKTLKNTADKRSLGLVLLVIALLMLALVIFELCFGAYKVPVSDTVKILFQHVFDIEPTWTKMAQNAVLLVRLPRVIGAILIGAALGLAGSCYQNIFHNPLVSPDLLGVSNGACIGAAFAILASAGAVVTQVSAFLGGIIAVILTVTIPHLIHKDNNVTLLLSGVIVAGIGTSVMGILKYVADPESQLAEIVYWQMGSFSKVTMESLPPLIPVLVICIIILILISWRINVLSLGEREIKALGVNRKLESGIVIVIATLLTASSVCLTGTISWVGLAMPHLARGLVGNDTSRLLPTVALLSGCFMLIIDIFARGSGTEIPISILTGLIGAPFFAVILARERSV